MAKLYDTFKAAESRVAKAIVALDLVNSTGMKQQQPEAAWLTTYGWFFDVLANTIEPSKGRVVKYLGDGGMVVFSDEHAAEAINYAIKVQEAIADAKASNRVSCECSIGIAYGDIVEFDTSEGGKDYIGSVADRAFRLCSAANANAIFVDTETVTAAAMNRVLSRVGASTAPKRKAVEYQGDVESTPAKGFAHPVRYHEILWASTRYGVRPEFVTKITEAQAPAERPVRAAGPARAAAVQWLRGRVVKDAGTYGFIRSGEEDFWFNNTSQLFRRALTAKLGDDIWFTPAESLPGSKSRRATDVLPNGSLVDGRLEKVKAEGYGFALVTNQRGVARQFFIELGDATNWTPGMDVEFTIGENRLGIAGKHPRERSASSK